MTHSRKRHQGEHGVAVIMTALCLIPLMAFAAFGVDLASWYSRVSFLQKSADAASLAGTVWMPDLGKATTIACDSLKQNGIDGGDCGPGAFGVEVERGSTPTSLRVTVTDPDATRYFSQVITGGDQTLTRSAEAEYNLPIPLGSPLNYFGGDAEKNTFTSVFSVNWPTDYQTRRPWNLNDTGGGSNYTPTSPCRVSDRSEFGGWEGSPPTWSTSSYNAGWQLCVWSARPNTYDTTAPTNAPCNVFGRDTSANGRWQNATTFDAGNRYTGSATGNRQCVWNQPGLLPPDFATRRPTNIPCNDYGVGSGAWGRWRTNNGGSHQGGRVFGTNTTSGKLCEWEAVVTSTPEATPNQIDPTRSPKFWAVIEGPGTSATQGDVYSTECYRGANCGSVQNAQYTPTSNPDRGYWYVVKIPAGLSGSVNVRVFDASFNADGGQTELAGDSSINTNGNDQNFETEFRVFKQTNPLDFTARSGVFSGGAGTQSEGGCWWELEQESYFRGQWRSLCSLDGVQPGDIFLVNVRTNDVGDPASGVNGYAIDACANGSCTTGVQPAVYAYSNMAMYNNVSSGTATFYLAEVGPQYAGRTLVVDLWDAGDSRDDATLYPMRPSTSLPKPVVGVPAADCSYTSSPSPNAVQSDAVGGATGHVYTTPRASDTPGTCGINTTIGTSSSNRQFNAEWLTIRIAIPSNYSCVPGINPETTANSCWWGIRYSFDAASTDVTTWQARIEGNPVHLTQ